VPYGYKIEELLAILHDHAPAKPDAVALQRRRVEHGLLSVGVALDLVSSGDHRCLGYLFNEQACRFDLFSPQLTSSEAIRKRVEDSIVREIGPIARFWINRNSCSGSLGARSFGEQSVAGRSS